MIVILIVPTGIGAEIGGHAGDATPVARLIAGACDTLITHPNVVNASDINEMTESTLYVEGSMLNRFLSGEIRLLPVKSNKILLAVNSPVSNNIVNSVSAARMTLGADISIIELKTPLRLIATMTDKGASGEVKGWEELVGQVSNYDFDALAIATPIEVDLNIVLHYVQKGTGVNPWGAVEAKASKLIAKALDKPVAHAPHGHLPLEDYNEIVEPRLAAEFVSVSYLHCILKGLHKAPRISYTSGISVNDVDCLISPINCIGVPHRLCLDRKIPIIAVKENKTCLNDPMPKEVIIATNYLEVVGMLLAIKQGITIQSVRRPVLQTKVIRN